MIYKGQRRVNHPKSNKCIGCSETLELKHNATLLLDNGYLCKECIDYTISWIGGGV